jgi:signal transduction histidine kinase
MSRQLERTITELKAANLELQKDIEKKERIDEMRKEFVSNVSHELKTPIALIQGYAEGLKEGVNDDPESNEWYCEVIMDEAAKMNNMVKKLLNLNQLEFGNNQISMEHFDLSALLDGVLSSFQYMFEQKDVNLIVNKPDTLMVWADEFMIEEVISNYVSNALNHVNGAKVITVEAQSIDGRAVISVKNTGPLIPEDALDKVWIKFYKVDKARTREYGGSGIGLSIVKAIMDSHNKPYGVYNNEDGVTFWFELDADAE